MFIDNEPVILTLPVKSCVLLSWLPKIVEPVTYSVEAVITWATIVWAVNVPRTKKLSAEDAVNAKEAVLTDEVIKFSAQLAVPNKEPVIPLRTVSEPVITAFFSIKTLPCGVIMITGVKLDELKKYVY